jgi:hypothetical protein
VDPVQYGSNQHPAIRIGGCGSDLIIRRTYFLSISLLFKKKDFHKIFKYTHFKNLFLTRQGRTRI